MGKRSAKHDQSSLRERLVELHQVCPGCGEPISVNDELHHWAHVFRRLPEPWKWDEIAVLLVHNRCHTIEAPNLNYQAAKMKIETFGSDAIESFAASAPTKMPITLPATYYEARIDTLGF